MSRLACFVPPDLLHEIARTARSAALSRSALDSLAIDAAIRTQRAENAARTLTVPMSASAGSGVPQRFIHDQRGAADMTPGPVVRAEGQPAVADPAVNQAYDNFGDTYKFYWEVLHRDSIDDQGMPIHGMVHFDTDYNNAFWDGEGHMWFGDGDGTMFKDFDGFVVTNRDNGGVHPNSGIPNRAFYLAASALGGFAWEVTGRIWYNAM